MFRVMRSWGGANIYKPLKAARRESYPLFYTLGIGGGWTVLCASCASFQLFTECNINWSDTERYCEVCEDRIDSFYTKP